MLVVLDCFELSNRAPPLRGLDIHMPSTLLQRYFLHDWGNTRYRQHPLITPLRPMHSLRLHVDLDSDETWSIKAGAGGLVQWLSSAIQLTKLDLKITDDRTYWIRYFGKVNFSRLRDLALSIESHHGLFVDFFWRHSRSLKKLLICISMAA